MNALNTLASSASLNVLADLMVKPLMATSGFDLIGYGVPNVQQQITKRLLDTAYSEITSLIASPEFRDYVPVADRGAHLSAYDDEYVGENRPMSFGDKLQAAVLAGAMVYRFSTHLAAIKGGNAAWATEGFEKDPEWVAVDPKDEHIVAICKAKGKEMLTLVANGDNRIRCEVGMVLPSVTSFGGWLRNKVGAALKKEEMSKWDMKLAQVLRVADEEMLGHTDIGIDTVKASIMNWANEPAYQRKVTRLEEAVIGAADTKWKFNYVEEIEAGRKIKPSPTNEILIAYSPQFKAAREEFSSSKELFDTLHTLLVTQVKGDAFEVKAAKKQYAQMIEWASADTKELLAESSMQHALKMKEGREELERRAARAQFELSMKRTVTKDILACRSAASSIAAAEKEMAELEALLNPVPKAKKAPKAKAAPKSKAKPKLVA